MAETSTKTYMTLTLPTPGERLGPTWASDLNTALNRIDEHDHSTIGKQLGSAALGIDSDLSFTVVSGTDTVAYAATNMKYLSLALETTLSDLPAATFANSVFAGGTTGDLYFNDGSGNQIQITSGGSLSASGVTSIAFAASTGESSGTFSITVGDNLSYYYVNTSTAPATVTLPAVGDCSGGRFFIVKDISGNAATNNITLNRVGSDLIDGATSYVTSSNYGSVTLISRGDSANFDVM